jgi:Domain of unknown function (DUF4397)
MKSILKVLVAFTLVVLFLPSCNDDEPEAGSAKYMIVYASPGAPSADVLVETQKVNSAPLDYPGNTGYLDILSGGRNFKLTQTGTTTLISEAQFVVPPNINFSIYFYDNPTAGVRSFAVLDDLNQPPGGKAHLRFFHLSPGGPTSVDVGKLSGSTFTTLFNDRGFETTLNVETSRKFIAVDAGNYDFDVRIGSVPVSVLTRPNVNLETGKIYTIYLRGIFNSTATPPDLEIIQHN